MTRWKKTLIALAAVGSVGFILIQFIPMGRFKDSLERKPNPAATNPIQWNSPETEALARAACYDCHSNETKWPWYSHVAPFSWLITRDVNVGRMGLNFSEYDPSRVDPEDLAWHLDNDMPLWYYLPLHPEAKLTDEEKQQLLAAISATVPQGMGDE